MAGYTGMAQYKSAPRLHEQQLQKEKLIWVQADDSKIDPKKIHSPARADYHPGKLRGAQTHYGDQTLVLLESLDACGGNFVMEDFAQRWSWLVLA